MSKPSREDALAQFRDGARLLREAVAGLSDADLGARPAPGEWSIREIVHHLADGELISAVRLRRLLTEDAPVITGYDEAVYASRMRYQERSVGPALAAFAAARALSSDLLSGLAEADWARTGIRGDDRAYGIEQWVRGNAGHVQEHIIQIGEIRRQIAR
ncbi:MAG: DinB family protein [Thermomicrobiales bacterium]|nr:DinB family protein [Thermomicrobiales bacterium]